jgi:hypothetical protein
MLRSNRMILNKLFRQVKIKVTLRRTISRPVRLGVRRPSGTCDQFFYLLEIFLKTVTVRYVVALSLRRGRVCNLLKLLDLASAVTLSGVCLLAVFRQYQSIMSHYLLKIFTLSVFDTVQGCVYNIYKASFSPGSVHHIMPQLPVAYATMTV